MGDSQKVGTVGCGPLHALLHNKPSILNEIKWCVCQSDTIKILK